MSASQEQALRHSDKPRSYLKADAREAIIAAVAQGKPQTQVAKDFGVHRNTVYEIVKSVKALQHEANPLRKEWRDSARTHAQQAVIAGLKHKRDPYRAANIGLDVLRGLGDLASGTQVNVDASQNVIFQWSSPVEPQDVVNAQCIDVPTTPVSD